MKEIEATGEFWLPDEPTRRFWGNLKFVPGEGVVLLLSGNFESRPFPSRGGLEVPILNGILFNGAPCTVLDGYCRVETFFTESGYRFRSEISARQMIVGVAFGDVEDYKFPRMSVCFSHLDGWFDNPIEIDYVNGFDDASIKWQPDSVDVVVAIDGISTRIQSFCERTMPSVASREGAKWTYRYNINIQPVEPQSISWFMKAASSLRRFFIFMIGTGVYTLDCSMFSASQDITKYQVLPVYIPVGIPVVVRPEPRYFSTRHQDVREELPELLVSWFNKEREVSTVLDSYTEALLIDGASPESLFLRTVQTLEHFHGLLWRDESRYVPKPVWRSFLRWLRDKFPAELPGVPEQDMALLLSAKDIIADRVAWLNGFSFRSRMDQIFRSVPGGELMPIMRNPISLDSHLSQFISRLEATRHYLTHFSEEQRLSSFDKDELETVTLQCWAVLTFWLAKFLGLSDELSGGMAQKAKNAMFLIDLEQRL